MCNSDSISESNQFSRKQNDYFDNNNYQHVLQYQEDYQLVSDQQNTQISNADLNSTISSQNNMYKELSSTEQRLNRLQFRLSKYEQRCIRTEQNMTKFDKRMTNIQQKLDKILKHLNISQSQIISSSKMIQVHKKYTPRRFDFLLRESGDYLDNVFNPDSTQTKDPVFVVLHCFRNKFYKNFHQILILNMLQFVQISKKMQATQYQLMLLLPFYYYLQCEDKSYSQKLNCQKGVATLLCVSDTYNDQKRKKYKNKILIQQQSKLVSLYQRFNKQCIQGIGLLMYMWNFFFKIGFKSYASYTQSNTTMRKNIIKLFSTNQNLWSHANQVFMAIILGSLKTHWTDGYQKVKMLVYQCPYINMEKTEQIMGILQN